MKKIFLSLALLCASTLSFADPTAAPTAPTYPANQVKAVYSATYNADCNFGEWGSGTAYTQEEYGKKYVTTNLGYFGLEFTGMNCSSMEKLHLDVWIADNASIRVVPIHGGTEVGVTKELTGGAWNSVEIALSEYAGVTDWTNVYQIKIDNASSLTFWLNNVYFYTTVAPEADTIAPTDFTAVVASESYFSVKIKANATDNSGVVKYDIIQDEFSIASGSGKSGEDAYITVAGLAPNTDYNFSVVAKDESGNMAEPVAVSAKTLVVPASAPTPTAAADDVKSLFSDAYETATAIETYNQNWWQGPSMDKAELTANDTVLFYSDFAEGSAFGWVFASLDVTDFKKLHLSVYPVAAAKLELWPVIQPEAEYHIITDTLAANEWNEIVLDYTDKTLASITQLGWITKNTFEGFFVDNVYFFKESGEEGIEDTADGVKAVKVIENGQLFIIKNGVRYNALGSEIK